MGVTGERCAAGRAGTGPVGDQNQHTWAVQKVSSQVMCKMGIYGWVMLFRTALAFFFLWSLLYPSFSLFKCRRLHPELQNAINKTE